MKYQLQKYVTKDHAAPREVLATTEGELTQAAINQWYSEEVAKIEFDADVFTVAPIPETHAWFIKEVTPAVTPENPNPAPVPQPVLGPNLPVPNDTAKPVPPSNKKLSFDEVRKKATKVNNAQRAMKIEAGKQFAALQNEMRKALLVAPVDSQEQPQG